MRAPNLYSMVYAKGEEVITWFKHPNSNVEEGTTIGSGTKVWDKAHIMKGAIIGDNCIIGEGVFIASGVVLGNGCKVQNGVNLYTGVTAEDYVFFGPACQTTNELYIGLLDEAGNPKTSWEVGYTHFKRGSAVGANATVICGPKDNPTVVGQQAVIGSGAVVTKSVEDFATVVGNPARPLKR